MSTQLEIIFAWDEMAGDWDDVAAEHAQAFYDLLRESLSITPDMIVLDFGCGTGLIADLLRHDVKQVVAVDVAPVMVEIAEEKRRAQEWENVQVYHVLFSEPGDEETLEILQKYENKIDLIIASSVLRYVLPETVGATMEVLGRLLKPGGYFLHTDPPETKGKQHFNSFTGGNAELYHEKGGLETVSAGILKMGKEPLCADVFLGIARKP